MNLFQNKAKHNQRIVECVAPGGAIGSGEFLYLRGLRSASGFFRRMFATWHPRAGITIQDLPHIPFSLGCGHHKMELSQTVPTSRISLSALRNGAACFICTVFIPLRTRQMMLPGLFLLWGGFWLRCRAAGKAWFLPLDRRFYGLDFWIPQTAT